MAPQLYKTHTLLKAVESMPKVHAFLRDTFFPKANDETFVTEDVLVDFKKGKRKMAPFVAPRVGGVTLTREGFKTERLTAPRLAPQRAMTIDDVSNRMSGESLVSTQTPAQRQKKLLATDLKELGESIDRREEWMAAQVLFNGSVDLSGYTGDKDDAKVEQHIDYGFDQDVVLSGTDLWTDADSDPYNDLKDWRKTVIKNSGVAPDTVILGEDAYKAFINHPKIIAMMDKININLGFIEPSVKSDAVTFVAKLPGLGLEIYTYDEYYEDENGDLQSHVPADKVLLAKRASGGFAYGAITQMEAGKQFVTYEGGRVPKTWADENNEVFMVKLSSRPVPKPGDVNGWLVATVL